MSRRNQIRMTDAEVEEFLRGRHTMSVATIGRDGRVHLVAMWYAFLDGKPAFWTYAKSQKIQNLRRDSRITVLVEDGEGYSELRGVEIVGTGTIIEDPDIILDIGVQLSQRYQGVAPNDDIRPMIAKQASKRLGVRIDADRIVSWDHRKLAGVY
jgi:PPOX class probable F420-dependent enzyme